MQLRAHVLQRLAGKLLLQDGFFHPAHRLLMLLCPVRSHTLQEKSHAVEVAEQRLAASSHELAAAQQRLGQAEVAAEAKLQAGSHAAEEASSQATAVAARLRDVEERERAVRAAQHELAQARVELGKRGAEVRWVRAMEARGSRVVDGKMIQLQP